MPKRRNQPEELFQRTVVEWLGWQYPMLMYFSVPNGGRRSKAESGILKATGVKAGVADLVFVWSDGAGARVGFVELKAPKGTQSDKQKIFEQCCDAISAPYIVAKTIEEIDVALNKWGAV